MAGKFQSKDSQWWANKQFISRNFGIPYCPCRAQVSISIKTMQRHVYFLCTSLCLPSFVQVQLSQIRDPVYEQYQQLPYYKLISKQQYQPCKLKSNIEHEEYPPCIHMDVTFDNPAERQPDVVTALKICTSCKSDKRLPQQLTMKVPSELPLIMAIGCGYPG